jgi:aspartate aminotransferase
MSPSQPRSFKSPNSPSTSTPRARLQNIAGHMSQTSVSSFPAEAVPQAPEDPLFGLVRAYKADTFEKKVDLGVGAYRDNNAKPYVLPVVKKVHKLNCMHDSSTDQNHRPMRSFEMTLR